MRTMKTFSQMRQSLNEGLKLDSGFKQVKSLKVGKKKKYDAVIAQKGKIFRGYIDGDHLEDFTSIADAEKGIKRFIDLAGK